LIAVLDILQLTLQNYQSVIFDLKSIGHWI